MLPEGDEHVEHDLPARRSPVLLVAGLVVSLVLAAGIGLGAYERVHRSPARYASAAVLILDQEPAVIASRDNGYLVKLTSLRIRYVDLVGTQVFTAALAQDLGLPLNEVGGSVVAVAPPESLLLRIIATGPDAQRARTIAQGAAAKLVKDIAAEQVGLGIPGRNQVTFTVVTPAQRAVLVAPLRKKAVEQGGAAGLVVLVLGAGLTVAAWRRR